MSPITWALSRLGEGVVEWKIPWVLARPWPGPAAGPTGQLSVTPRPHGPARGVVEVAVK